ncbi:MAG: hypothetical protein VX589_15750 [Myxococcota bacterium]|nr:hypothetical protein [Myxococcota bacterium]
MLRMIALLFVIAVAALIWALQPAPPVTISTDAQTRGDASSSSPNGQTSGQRERRVAQGTDVGRRIAKNRPESDGRTAQKPRIARGPDSPPNPNDLNLPNTVVATQPGLNPRARHDRPDILAHPVHTEGPYGVKNYKQPGEFMDPPRQPTQEDNSFPRVQTAQFVQSVRSFYNDLPKSGALPTRILVEDVLPIGLVQSVGIPAESELKMLGPYNTTDIKAFEDALKVQESGSQMYGISYETPDGKKHRKYIRLDTEP